jgi:hypothetical protein
VEDNDSVTDLLRRIRTEIDQRLAASRAAVEEMERLEAALRALEGVGGPATPEGGATSARRARASSNGARRRAPRGANRDAVLRAVSERPGASAAELSSASGVAANAVYVQLGRLVADGIVVKRELPSGRSGYAPVPPSDPSAPEAQPPPVPPPDTVGPAPVPDEAAEHADAGDDAGRGSDTRPPGTYTGEG